MFVLNHCCLLLSGESAMVFDSEKDFEDNPGSGIKPIRDVIKSL